MRKGVPYKRNFIREEARKIGKKTFFDGEPCFNGHISEKRTDSNACVICLRKRNIITSRNYRRKKENKEKCRRYRENNSEKICAYKKIYSKKYLQENKEKIYILRKIRSSMKRSNGGKFNKNDIFSLLRIQRCECVYCKKNISKKFEIDHIIPVVKGGTSFCGNLQLLCVSCNRKKYTMLPVNFKYRLRNA